MRVHVLTRGYARHLDYGYLDTVPESWWRSLREWTSTDRPAVLARGSGTGVSVLISGIPSARRDVLGREIRFTLVLEADAADAERVAGIVRAALTGAGRDRLGTELDGELPAEEVDSLLEAVGEGAGVAVDGPGRDGGAVGARIERLLAKQDWAADAAPAAASVAAAEEAARNSESGADGETVTAAEPATAVGPESADGHGGVPEAGSRVPVELASTDLSWVGSIGHPGAEASFAARVAALADGALGYAVTLNLVLSEGRAKEVATQLGRPAALMLPEGVMRVPYAIEGKDEEGPASTGLSRVLTLGGHVPTKLLLLLLPVAFVIGAVVVVIKWVLGRP